MYRFFLLQGIFLLCFFTHNKAKADSFEGSVRIVYETVFDTIYIDVMVKGDRIRVDEYTQDHQLNISKIINVPHEKAIAISHARKEYTNMPAPAQNGKSEWTLNQNKTGNYKEINGYKCYQWRVKDMQRNTEISYWVAEGKLGFLETILKYIDNTSYSMRIYSSIPDSDAFFPLLTEERTLLRKEKSRIAVVEIKETALNPQIFEIPMGYHSINQI